MIVIHLFPIMLVELMQKRHPEDGSRTGWTLTVKVLVKTSSNTPGATRTTQVWAVIYQIKPITKKYHKTSMRSLSLRADITRPKIPNIEGRRNGSLIEFLTPASIVEQILFPMIRSSLLMPRFV